MSLQISTAFELLGFINVRLSNNVPMMIIMFVKRIAALTMVVWSTSVVWSAPQVLESVSLESPDAKYAANVEWDAVGFIGRIKMLAFTTSEDPSVSIELPQMNPAPANLTWIDDKWVACESFIAEQGGAFCYLDVPRKKAYLVEILAPEEKSNWIISYTTNDSVSTDTIHTASQGHSSLFPILLRDLPEEGNAYFTPDFVMLMSDAVDAFTQWRKKEKFTELKVLSDITSRPSLGALLVADIDNSAELIYFPMGTTTTREMLALTQRKKLPDNVQVLLNGINPPELRINWVENDGEFVINGYYSDSVSSTTELVKGRFEGVKDAAYTGPGVKDLIVVGTPATTSGTDKKDSPSSEKPGTASKTSSKPTSSKSDSSKKPSRSK